MTIQYHEEVANFIQPNKSYGWSGKRKHYVQKYSWAIPTQDAVRHLSTYDHILEIGAGNGYWAYEIQKHGGTITPIDISIPSFTWTTVHKSNYTDIPTDSPLFETVFLCWPPANNSLAADVLDYAEPQKLIFAGIENTTVTGSSKFFKQLQNNYTRTYATELPSWTSFTETFTCFKEK